MEGSEISHYYDLLTQREEVDVIYEKYARTEGQMSTRDLLNFLLSEQREEASTEDALRLIEKYELDGTGRFTDVRNMNEAVNTSHRIHHVCLFSFCSPSAKQKKHMTKDGFLMYLNHEEGSILQPAHKHVYQDMRQPLNDYFISSSHNTYLMEDQLKGPSSIEAYIR